MLHIFYFTHYFTHLCSRCLWHGCPSCYGERRYERNKFNGLSFQELYEKWEEKRKDIESENIQVNWIWECQFKQLQRENVDIIEYAKSIEAPRRLIPRNGLRGCVK